MPKFTDKVETAHDINQVRHLFKGNKKMSELMWELNLRPDLYKYKPPLGRTKMESERSRNDKNEDMKKALSTINNKKEWYEGYYLLLPTHKNLDRWL